MSHTRERGFTIVENVVALAILTIVSTALMGAMVMLKQLSSTSRVMTTNEKQVSDIADSIRLGIEDYQIDFSHTLKLSQVYSPTNIEQVLAVPKLPMSWDVGVAIAATKCPQCAGRYGFVIQPYGAYPGLYIVTLRMTHRAWKSAYRDYQFVVSVK
jgi:prepilin-type N-terminal cleavage/methylation domain-containing protein